MNLTGWQECEVNYPGVFAAACAKPYGVLFYNRDNPDSYDCNHAVILNRTVDLERAVEEIVLFYRLRGLTPCVFPSYMEGEREELIPLLMKRGFDIEKNDNRLFVLESRSAVKPYPPLRVRRVTALDRELGQMLRGEDRGTAPHDGVMRRLLPSPNFHLLAGFAGEQPVGLAALTLLGGMSRLSDLMVHKKLRGRGYGRALVQGVLDYHRTVSRNKIYLWTENPVAAAIYKEAGFVEYGRPLRCWMAYKIK